MDSKTFEEKGLHHKNIMVYAAENELLAEKLEEWCKQNGKKMIYAYPDTYDFFMTRSFVIIADRNFIKRDCWEDFCDIFLKPGIKAIPSTEKNNGLSTSLPDYPIETRIILIDKNVYQFSEEWFILPYIHAEDIFLVEQDNFEEIVNILNAMLYLL